jgi:hypothetical protein
MGVRGLSFGGMGVGGQGGEGMDLLGCVLTGEGVLGIVGWLWSCEGVENERVPSDYVVRFDEIGMTRMVVAWRHNNFFWYVSGEGFTGEVSGRWGAGGWWKVGVYYLYRGVCLVTRGVEGACSVWVAICWGVVC